MSAGLAWVGMLTLAPVLDCCGDDHLASTDGNPLWPSPGDLSVRPGPASARGLHSAGADRTIVCLGFRLRTGVVRTGRLGAVGGVPPDLTTQRGDLDPATSPSTSTRIDSITPAVQPPGQPAPR